MRLPRPRFTVLRLMTGIALVAGLFSLAPMFSSESPTATVDFVNKTSHPVGRVEIYYPGGLVRLDNLPPGEVTRRRVQASQVFPPSGFNIRFVIRITEAGSVRHGSHCSGFDPYNYQPSVRWELTEDSAHRIDVSPKGLMERPTSKIKRYMIDTIYRLR